jgi:hypothetical protein
MDDTGWPTLANFRVGDVSPPARVWRPLAPRRLINLINMINLINLNKLINLINLINLSNLINMINLTPSMLAARTLSAGPSVHSDRSYHEPVRLPRSVFPKSVPISEIRGPTIWLRP